jgi:hypothetical protein
MVVPDEQKTKKCRTCGGAKALDEFSKATSYADGHKSQCKACDSKYQKTHWAKSHPPSASPLAGSRSPSRSKPGPKSRDKAGRATRPLGDINRPASRLTPFDEPAMCALDFTDYPEVLAALDKEARLNIRTLEHQAMFYIVSALKKEQPNA